MASNCDSSSEPACTSNWQLRRKGVRCASLEHWKDRMKIQTLKVRHISAQGKCNLVGRAPSRLHLLTDCPLRGAHANVKEKRENKTSVHSDIEPTGSYNGVTVKRICRKNIPSPRTTMPPPSSESPDPPHRAGPSFWRRDVPLYMDSTCGVQILQIGSCSSAVGAISSRCRWMIIGV